MCFTLPKEGDETPMGPESGQGLKPERRAACVGDRRVMGILTALTFSQIEMGILRRRLVLSIILFILDSWLGKHQGTDGAINGADRWAGALWL